MKAKHIRLLSLLTAFAVILSLASCGTSRSTARRSSHGYSTSSSTKKHTSEGRKPASSAHFDPKKIADNPTTLRLLTEADSWIGTPYRWGGNDRNGVDCSGFVLQVYLKSLEISLPRNSEKQMQYCLKIKKEDMVPGDLVFFTVRGGSRVGHVGIFIGNNNFVHSSSSKGVTVTSLDNPYFVKNFFSCGRVERYFAMLDKKGTHGRMPAAGSKSGKSGQVQPKPQQPALAKTGRTAAPKQNQKKSIENTLRNSENKFETPLPSQVFASKQPQKSEPDKEPANQPQPDTQEEEPDFFD